MDIQKGKNGVRWVNIEKPTNEDLEWLRKEFGIHPLIIEELRGPSARARVENYKNYLFFIYYFPLYSHDHESALRNEIDFIIADDTVITIHYEPIKKVFERVNVENFDSTLVITHHILQELIIFEERQLRHIREKVEAVGLEIFKEKEKEVLKTITYLKRDISEYRIIVRLQDPVLRSLLVKGKKFWADSAEVYLNDIIGEQLKIISQIEDYRETIADFEETNAQLMNAKTTTVMQTFTTLSFLTSPFIFLATLLTMPTRDTPLINRPGAFWIVFGIMVSAMLTLFFYFKRKKWI